MQRPKDAEPTFFIGTVPIYGDLILAPMAGYSDVPFRLLCREMGSALSYTPCIPDDALAAKGHHHDRLLDFREEERPVAIQLLAKEEGRLIRAAEKALQRRPDILDLNLGCPAHRVAGGGRGAALLCNPPLIGRLVSALVQSAGVPITAKIRLGWDENTRNYRDVARILEESGISAIAVHGRTRSQAFRGKADWEAIAEVKTSVRVPVFANGDVRTPEDIVAIQRVTGCDAVMIGRGAIGNPWIFQRRSLDEVPFEERLAVMERHLQMMVAYYGVRLGVILFRKYVVHYVRGLEGASALRPRLVAAPSADQVLEILRGWRESERSTDDGRGTSACSTGAEDDRELYPAP